MSPLYRIPIGVLGALVMLLVVLGLELGNRLGRRIPVTDREFSNIATPVLALVGLLFAFSFSMAFDRMALRRAATVDEANSIGTFWLRTELLPAPVRDEMRGRLRKYLDLHYEAREAGLDEARVAALEAEGRRVQDELWALLVKQSESTPEARSLLLVTPALNTMIDAESSVLAARENRLPDPIVGFLVLMLVVSGFIVGYGSASERRNVVLWATFVVALGGVLVLLVDMDRPLRGLIRTGTEPYVRLRQSIEGR